ncbi:hypothetical protein DPMN_103197 [Dreissena polymorpha]|uniref:Uncharacterized protein n=1 Tax=Dreissena polymorpha TaxID=45954 RepID=A0A9D4HAP3_DREPO|nr:hypothetical protein DPMN_103197 [Dreissena polymorpha]
METKPMQMYLRVFGQQWLMCNAFSYSQIDISCVQENKTNISTYPFYVTGAEIKGVRGDTGSGWQTACGALPLDVDDTGVRGVIERDVQGAIRAAVDCHWWGHGNIRK